uniref:Solute carrier family 25 member 44 n=1 Tax=Amazona collaria TaxID=241587 RepID=A0A8B9J065_9PSIT
MEDKRNIPIIEWEHLDKRKFYVLGICMTMMIRILRTEGTAGLYRGFLVNTFTLISGQCYVTTYELTRKYVARYNNNNAVKSLVAGGSASLVAQSITVPIDVVSQHLMMQRKGESMGRFKVRNQDGKRLLVFGQTKDIIVQIFKADGFRGFYRGYVASLLTYIPNSAVWWPFYHFYAEQLSGLTPKDCPHLLLQAISGPLAAATASTLTNPMDVIRARVQVRAQRGSAAPARAGCRRGLGLSASISVAPSLSACESSLGPGDRGASMALSINRVGFAYRGCSTGGSPRDVASNCPLQHPSCCVGPTPSQWGAWEEAGAGCKKPTCCCLLRASCLPPPFP